MPLLRLETTVVLEGEKQKALLAGLSRIVAETIGKPEEYVMVTINRTDALMAGKPGAAAFVDVRSIGGLGGQVNRLLSQKVCQFLNRTLGVEANRVYLNFTHVDGANWGTNGSTFG